MPFAELEAQARGFLERVRQGVVDKAFWDEVLSNRELAGAIVSVHSEMVSDAAGRAWAKRSWIDRETLEQHARCAMYSLLLRFNPERGIPLGAYLNKYVPLRAVDLCDAEDSVPRKLRRNEAAIRAEESALREKDGAAEKPAQEDVQQSLGISQKQFEKVRRWARAVRPLSLDQPADRSEDAAALGDLVSDKRFGVGSADVSLLENTVDLDTRSRVVLELKFHYGVTNSSIASVFQLSESSISIFVHRSLERLRRAIEGEELPSVHDAENEKRLGADCFLRSMECVPDAVPSWEWLDLFMASPRDLMAVAGSANPSVHRFWGELTGCEGDIDLEKFDLEARDFVRVLLLRTFHHLDMIQKTPDLLKLAGEVRESISHEGLASRLVDCEIFSPKIPYAHPLTGAKYRSLYFRPVVVGKSSASENIEAALRWRYETLDKVLKSQQTTLTASLIQAAGTQVRAVRRELVEQGILSGALPKNYVLPPDMLSAYLDVEVVGEKQKQENLAQYLKENFATIDDLPYKHAALAKALGCENTKEAMARACVALPTSYLSDKIPPRHLCVPNGGTVVTLFFEPKVVGVSVANQNIASFTKENFPTVSSLSGRDPTVQLLMRHLGLKGNLEGFVRWCLAQGVYSPEFPDGDPVSHGKSPDPHLLLRASVVGESQALKNLKTFLKQRYAAVKEIPRSKQLAKLLGCEASAPSIRERVVELGWY
ncbi:MAG: hypothetical protein KDD64_02300 [Bdellovibrionales bacterium]|nr:hypothetical protein [Bdellovibrionales bacterium]